MKLKSSAAVNREVDMCEGPILKKLIVFALPLMATNVLQVLFNAADVSILGIFIKDVSRANAAVAAVGATSSLINPSTKKHAAFLGPTWMGRKMTSKLSFTRNAWQICSVAV